MHTPSTMRRRLFCLSIACMLVSPALVAPNAYALTPQEQHVSVLTSDVIKLAHSGQRGNQLQASVTRLLNRHSSISSVARFALGPYAGKLPANRKNEYFKLVERYVAILFSQYVKDFAGTGVQIDRSRASGKFVIVDSTITSTGTRLQWRIQSNGAKHRVADVNFRGIWLSIRMRDQFVSVLKKNNGDFDALMNYLRSAA